MSTKALVLSVAGVGCVVAASVGGFLATQTTARAPEVGVTAPLVPAAPAASVEASPRATAVESRTASARALRPDAAASVERAPREASPASRPARRGTRSAAPEIESASDRTVAPPASGIAAPPIPATPPVVEPAAPAPAKPQFDELTIEEAAVIGIELDSAISSKTAKVEDKVSARVSRDVTVGGKTAIPSGARVEGHVTLVESGGKFKDRARVGVRFTTIVLGERTRVPIQTEAIFREGDAPGMEATSKVGGSAAVGAILGAVIGGKKGAAIGTAAGAAGGTAVVMAGDRNHAVLTAGAPLTLRLTAPVTVLIEREHH
jgi:hypothetical protein